MRRSNGGIIGPDNVTTGGFTGVASGVWKLNEATDLIRQNKWPEPNPFPVNITPNSLRFNTASSDSLTRTQSASPTSATKGTLSFWIKRSLLDVSQYYMSTFQDSNNRVQSWFQADNTFKIIQKVSASTTIEIITNRVFRDPSAWYHVVLAFDTDQGTSSNRVKIYINGDQETSFSTATYPAQGQDSFLTKGTSASLGAYNGSGDYTSAYFSEIVLIDGQQLTPTSFAETNSDTGIWVPKTITGLTFGTNGYYLKFANSAALGTDSSGEGNNFTVNNLTSLDQTTDSPSNNWCTWNFLDRYYTQAVFSDGNCTVQTPNASETYCTSTFKMSSGKWYAEISTYDGSNRDNIGIVDSVATANNGSNNLYQKAKGYSYRGVGGVWNNDSQLSGTFASYGSPNTIGVAVDLDNNLIYFSKDGVWQNSADPSSGTGGVSITAAASLTEGSYFFAVGDEVTSDDTTYRANFGNPAYALTSAVADGNGLGQFEYTPPTGFVSLCTNNLNL
jgi:hypothetical protein